MSSIDDEVVTQSAEGRSGRPVISGRTLMVYHHDGVDAVPLVPSVPVVIGRGSSSDLVCRGARLSRRHARFELVDGAVWVTDLGSTNGTLINNQPVEAATRINLGDEVMLGAVVVSLTEVPTPTAHQQGLDPHDRFQTYLRDEMVRARTFHRPAALLMVEPLHPEDHQLHRWCPRIRRLLRPVDRIGLYGPGLVEILLVEGSTKQAGVLAEAIVQGWRQGEPHLLAGVAIYPDAGRSADELFAAARAALQEATEDERIRFAAQPQGHSVQPSDDLADASGPVIRSPAMVELYQTAERIASASIPVLLLGETGTGKEVLARELHRRSRRSDKPLHCINCGAIPEQLISSVLFGHERGAFTSADRSQEGVFEAANGGTVLLDEIGELPLAAQAALLRVLDTKQVRRVGSTTEKAVDVRVIASTNRDLEDMGRKGTFRQDLFHRINAMTLRIPPLRERLAEVKALAQHFAERASAENNRHVVGVSPQALSCLLAYSWPGNIRELRNVIDRAVLIALGDQVEVEDLPDRLRAKTTTVVPADADLSPARLAVEKEDDQPTIARKWKHRDEPSRNFKQCMEMCERALIHNALAVTAGNQSRAAERLNLPRRTLVYKMRAYNIRGEPDPEGAKLLASLSKPGDNDLVFKDRMECIEKRLITRVLAELGGDRGNAAEELGLHRRTLDIKLRKYGIA